MHPSWSASTRSRQGLLAWLLVTGVATVAAACGDAATPIDQIPSAIRILSGDSQTAVVGTALGQPLAVTVFNSTSAPLSNVVVTFVASDNGTFSAAQVTSDANGQAKTTFTVGTTSGTVVVSAQSATVSKSATFHVTAQVGAPAANVKVSGDNQTAAAGTHLGPCIVRIDDQYGNPVPNVSVSWTTTGGTLSNQASITSAGGQAVTTLTLPNTTGPQTVTAHVAGLTDVTFTLTAT